MSQLQKRYMSPGSHIQYHERHDSTLKKISCRELERWPYATAHGFAQKVFEPAKQA